MSNYLSDVQAGTSCIACGACTAVDDSVTLNLDKRTGLFQLSDAGNKLVREVCPSVFVDLKALSENKFGAIDPSIAGHFRKMWLASNNDHEENFAASSGGVIRPILSCALENHLIESVISLKENRGIDFTQVKYGSVEDLKQMPRSIYHAVDQSALYEILLTSEEKFAIVGIPCQLEGLEKFFYNPSRDVCIALELSSRSDFSVVGNIPI